MQIRNRVRELRRVKAADLVPNPKNWRTHPKGQQDALRGILAEVGYADALLARELPDGSLMLVDGQLRAETTPEQEVPVLVLDISEAEADKLLLSLDPLAALAETNAVALDALLREVDTGSEGLQQMYADLAEAAGVIPPDFEPASAEDQSRLDQKAKTTRRRRQPARSADMSSRPELRLDWATAAAARFACTNWHYSKCVPVFKAVRVGVWECGQFIGVVLFGQGATPEIGSPYGLKQIEICELTRVALTRHVSPVSKIIALALRFLRKQSPGLRMVVSFADASQGHHGGIYQAGGWVYVGGAETHGYRVNGTVVHPKTLHSRYGKGGQSIPWLRANVDPHAERVVSGFKHRYLMPLDEEMRREIEPLRKPYPKRAGSAGSGTPPIQGGRGGATPTPALSSTEETNGQARPATGADDHQDGEGKPRQKAAQQKRAKAAKR